MTQLFSNNASALLAIELLDDDLQITVQGGFGSLFPDPDFAGAGEFFLVSLNDISGQQEICRCTERLGDVLTVDRGWEGTTPVLFVVGSRVEDRITAGTMDQLIQSDSNINLSGNDIIDAGDVDATTITLSGTLIDATAAEINLLSGATEGSILPSGTALLFYQAAAPTGWTKKLDSDISDLTGSTIRIVEGGTGGGAVAGTDDIDSPPSMDHSHADSFSNDGTALSVAQLPSHRHFAGMGLINNDGTIIYGVTATDLPGDAWQWVSQDNATPQVQALTSLTGSNATHTHTQSGSVEIETITEFAPKYVDVILCQKD